MSAQLALPPRSHSAIADDRKKTGPEIFDTLPGFARHVGVYRTPPSNAELTRAASSGVPASRREEVKGLSRALTAPALSRREKALGNAGYGQPPTQRAAVSHSGADTRQRQPRGKDHILGKRPRESADRLVETARSKSMTNGRRHQTLRQSSGAETPAQSAIMPPSRNQTWPTWIHGSPAHSGTERRLQAGDINKTGKLRERWSPESTGHTLSLVEHGRQYSTTRLDEAVDNNLEPKRENSIHNTSKQPGLKEEQQRGEKSARHEHDNSSAGGHDPSSSITNSTFHRTHSVEKRSPPRTEEKVRRTNLRAKEQKSPENRGHHYSNNDVSWFTVEPGWATKEEKSRARSQINDSSAKGPIQSVNIPPHLEPIVTQMIDNNDQLYEHSTRSSRDEYSTGEDTTITFNYGLHSGRRQKSTRSPRPTDNANYEEAHSSPVFLGANSDRTVWAYRRGNRYIDAHHELRIRGKEKRGSFIINIDSPTTRTTFSATHQGDGEYESMHSVYKRRKRHTSSTAASSAANAK